MSKRLKGWERDRLGERQNWRCCFCGVRMIARTIQDPKDYALQNGIRWTAVGKNQITSRRTSNIFRLEGHTAVCCSYCISAKADTPLAAWIRIVEMQVLAGTHPSHQTGQQAVSITYEFKKPKPWGKIRARQQRQREKRPKYAHSEMM